MPRRDPWYVRVLSEPKLLGGKTPRVNTLRLVLQIINARPKNAIGRRKLASMIFRETQRQKVVATEAPLRTLELFDYLERQGLIIQKFNGGIRFFKRTPNLFRLLRAADLLG